MMIYLQMIDTPEDRTKFEQIYYAYRDLLYHVAFRILNQQEDAEDAVHDTFLKIIEQIEKISVPVCPQTRCLIVIIVRSKALDMLRRRKRYTLVAYEDAFVDGFELELPDQSIGKCLSALPTRYRDVLLLHHQYGYTLKEIADLLEASPDSIKKLHQRAMQRFQKLCEQEGLL